MSDWPPEKKDPPTKGACSLVLAGTLVFLLAILRKGNAK